MRSILLVVAMAALAAPLSAADADQSFFNVALFNPVQIFPEGDDIRGIRLNLIYGKNANVSGIDVGFIAGHVTGDFKGLQWQPINLVDGKFEGWQNGWLLARTRGEFQGLQSAAINLGKTRVEGVQFGLVNSASDMSGLQLGIVNLTEQMYGLQIGLVNIIESKDKLPILPIINWRF